MRPIGSVATWNDGGFHVRKWQRPPPPPPTVAAHAAMVNKSVDRPILHVIISSTNRRLNRKHPAARICRAATKDRRWVRLLMPTIEIIPPTPFHPRNSFPPFSLIFGFYFCFLSRKMTMKNAKKLTGHSNFLSVCVILNWLALAPHGLTYFWVIIMFFCFFCFCFLKSDDVHYNQKICVTFTSSYFMLLVICVGTSLSWFILPYLCDWKRWQPPKVWKQTMGRPTFSNQLSSWGCWSLSIHRATVERPPTARVELSFQSHHKENRNLPSAPSVEFKTRIWQVFQNCFSIFFLLKSQYL